LVRKQLVIAAGLASFLPHLALLALARGTLVLALADVFFVGEELSHGAAAKAILDGLPVALPRLSYQYYEGGGLIASLLTVPVFHLLGPCHLANKLVALGFDATNLVLGVLLARRYFGRAAEWAFSLLYVFGPAACQQIALLNVGNHHQAISFFFLLPLLAYPILRLPAGARPSGASCARLGAAAGLGLTFNFMLAPLLAFLAAALLVLRPRLLDLRNWLFLLLGFTLGSALLIWTACVAGSALLDIHGIDLLDSFGAPPTTPSGQGNWGALLAATGPRAELELLGLLVLPLLGAVLCLRPGRRADPRDGALLYGLLLLFLALFTTASVVSRFHPTYFHVWASAFRYMPHWGLAVLLSAGALGYLAEHPARAARAAAVAVCALLVGLGVWAHAELVVQGKARDLRSSLDLLTGDKGYDYYEYLPKLVAHLPPEPDGSNPRVAQARLLTAFRDDPRALYPPVAWSLYPRFDRPPSEALDELREAGGEAWQEFLPGLGRAFLASSGYDLRLAVSRAAARRDPGRSRILDALGRNGSGAHPLPSNLQREIDLLIECGAPREVFRGLGFRIQTAFRLAPEEARAFVAAQDRAVSGPLAEGLEEALALARVDGRTRVRP